MPPGAKKRKAAKKKKEKEAYSNSNNSSSIDSTHNNSSQGNDDKRSQDERDRDAGEVAAPVSQDQHEHQQPFNDGDEGSDNRAPPDMKFSENEQMEEVRTDAEGRHGLEDAVNVIQTDLDSRQSEVVNIEHIESSKESHGDESSSSSSSSSSSRSSSSDDESQTLQKKWKDEKAAESFSKEAPQISENEKQPTGSDGNSIDANMAVPVVPISADSADLEVLEVLELGIEENKDKLLPSSTEFSQAAVVLEETEDKVFPQLDDKVTASSNLISHVNGNEGKISTSSSKTGETGNVGEIVKPSETSNGTMVPNEDKIPTSSGACTKETTDGADIVKTYETSDGTGNGNEDKILVPSAHAAEIIYDAETAKKPDARECTENQPLVASAPRMAQRTSWLSCCGLFDAFTGSSR